MEQVTGIERAGRGFGVVLHAEDGMLLVANTGDSLVVQINVSDFKAAGDACRIDRVGAVSYTHLTLPTILLV